MKKIFKIKKGQTDEADVIDNLRRWIEDILDKQYYDKKKKHYVDEIQNTIKIKVELKVIK